MENADLELAGQARRYLHWAMFLLAASLAIMIIDYQLKKAVARQAMVASRLYTDLVVRYGGPARPGAAGDGDHLGDGGGGDHVDGTGPGPADDDHPDRESPPAHDAAPGRKTGRAPGDGQ